MRILITVPDLNELGGVATYYRAIEGNFENEVDYLQIGGWQGIASKSKFRLGLQFLLDILRVAWKAPRYDLIHFNPSFCARCFFREMVLLAIVKLFRKKVVILIHGWNWDFASFVDRKLRWLFHLGYRGNDTFIVLAKEFKEKLQAWGYAGPIYVETTLVDDACMKTVAWNGARNLKEPLRLLYLARLERAKGVFQCVEALARLASSAFQLIVAGNGNDREELETLIKQKGLQDQVVLLGWVSGESKVEAFSSADIFLFPSSYGEGMPITVLEAMAYGLPVITSPVGGIKDFFKEGKMGFLIDPIEVEKLSECIKRLHEQPELRRQIGEYNRQYAKDHFYASRVVKRLESIYAEVNANACRPDMHTT